MQSQGRATARAKALASCSGDQVPAGPVWLGVHTLLLVAVFFVFQRRVDGDRERGRVCHVKWNGKIGNLYAIQDRAGLDHRPTTGWAALAWMSAARLSTRPRQRKVCAMSRWPISSQ